MKTKSVLRRLEQLEKKIMPPKRGGVEMVIIDHEPTDEDRAKYVGYDQVMFIIEDRLKD